MARQSCQLIQSIRVRSVSSMPHYITVCRGNGKNRVGLREWCVEPCVRRWLVHTNVMTNPPDSPQDRRRHRTLGSLIFFSRWLQAPLYLGLILAQGV